MGREIIYRTLEPVTKEELEESRREVINLLLEGGIEYDAFGVWGYGAFGGEDDIPWREDCAYLLWRDSIRSLEGEEMCIKERTKR